MMRSCRVSEDTRSDEKEKVETLGVSDPKKGRTVSGPGRRKPAQDAESKETIIDTLPTTRSWLGRQPNNETRTSSGSPVGSLQRHGPHKGDRLLKDRLPDDA